MSSEPNSTSITIEIQRVLIEVARLTKADRNDPRIEQLMSEVRELSQVRMNLSAA